MSTTQMVGRCALYIQLAHGNITKAKVLAEKVGKFCTIDEIWNRAYNVERRRIHADYNRPEVFVKGVSKVCKRRERIRNTSLYIIGLGRVKL